MDSRIVHSHVQDENEEQNSHNIESQQVTLTHGVEENQSSDHEKKSVLNKVKAKAKKIKDTIKKHGQQVLDNGNGHNNQIQHTPDDDDGDLDDDKEIVQDRELNQVPIYDSEDVKSPTSTPESEKVENLGNSGIDIEGTKVKGEEPYHDTPVEGDSLITEINQNIANDQAKTFPVEEKPEQYKANLEKPAIVFEEYPQKQGIKTEEYTLPNYQINHTDPSGAENDEIKDNIKPLEESLERINVHDDEPKLTKEPKIQSSVADIKYPPEAYTLLDDQTKDTHPNEEGSDEVKGITPLEESLERLNVHDESKPTTEQKFQPSVAADNEYPPAAVVSHDQFVPDLSDATKTQNEYPQETASTDINRDFEIPSETREPFNNITTTADIQPGYEESVKTQPKHKSYTDEIEISQPAEEVDTTIRPEDDEVSKLGIDEKGDEQKSENGKNIGYSLTEKLTPVYGKVAEVGNAVKSKVYGTNDGSETKNGDKGVTVKDYLAEKLKPSEEDKALSEVISEALHKGKEDPLKKEDGKVDSEVEKSEKVFEDSNVNSQGKGVVGKVKDVVGSWFVKSPQGGGSGEDLSENKKSVGEVEQVVDEGGKQE
ncbi:low-temperature-induced 65 kDa protein-like isoform X1 [Trifolium pratense]|uniref:low-temperature-induced 65 kDa protein-like isoform X1 n=1 Tax=Trifolium pratense TaxID=57577 RepID=UPI001E690168|nr:low-temperature-induced 65 kDa protein-like isoform X1 [Trifolium pratense]